MAQVGSKPTKHRIEFWHDQKETIEWLRKKKEEGHDKIMLPLRELSLSLDLQKVIIRKVPKDEAEACERTHLGWKTRASIDFREGLDQKMAEEAWNKMILAKMGSAYYTLTRFFGLPSGGGDLSCLWTFALEYKGNHFDVADCHGYKINILTPEDVVPRKEVVEELKEIIEYLLHYGEEHLLEDLE